PATGAYVAFWAVQEDNYMGPRLPLAWLLVDRRLRDLEPPPGLSVAGYYTTIGDEPKLPGCEVTFFGDLARDAAMQWSRSQLVALGFRASQSCGPEECFFDGNDESASVLVFEDSGHVHVRAGIFTLASD
ncbi:MAG: hypothetical protein JW751_12385, partial [Polyangiaceae bacterium]|nr:hypothetical protein [Polyangiaceae bacterium]